MLDKKDASNTNQDYRACRDLWMLYPSMKKYRHVEEGHKHCQFLNTWNIQNDVIFAKFKDTYLQM